MRSRPARGRPTWWAILAVSLALIALVAATATRSNSPGAPRLATDTGSTSTTTTTRPHPPVTSTTVPTLVVTSTPTTLLHVGSSTGASGASGASHMVNATTTTTVPPPPPTTTTTAASSEAVYPGYLQPPNDTSTTYRFTGAGPTTVSVTWSSSTYLSLNVTCSGFDQTTGGSSVISLSIPNAQGTCQAVLSEPSPATSEVSYTLTVDPAGG